MLHILLLMKQTNKKKKRHDTGRERHRTTTKARTMENVERVYRKRVLRKI